MRLWDVGDLLGCLRSSNLRGLSSVTSMDISLASALSELPASFTALSSLQELRLRWVDLTALPAARDGLQSMRTLRLRECSKLSSIGPISSLTQLSIHGCGKLKRLPGLAGMSSLQELDICRCGALGQLPNSISQLTQLTRLHLSHLPAMKALPEGLCGLTSLQELRVTNCGSIVNLPSHMQQLTALHSVSIISCNRLAHLPPGQGQLPLNKLSVSCCCGLHSIRGDWKKVSISSRGCWALHVCITSSAVWLLSQAERFHMDNKCAQQLGHRSTFSSGFCHEK